MTGLADFSRGNYKRALTSFDRVREYFPQHPYAARYVSQAQQRISAGDDRTPGGIPWTWVIISVLGLGFLATVTALVLIIRRQNRTVPGGGIPPTVQPLSGLPNAARTTEMPVVAAEPPPVALVQPTVPIQPIREWHEP